MKRDPKYQKKKSAGADNNPALQELIKENAELKSQLQQTDRLIDVVGQMAESYRHKFDVLPDRIQLVIMSYDRLMAKEGEDEKAQMVDS